MQSDRPLRVGFMMDQIAGHVTSYRNLRQILDDDPSVEPVWFEIEYSKPHGLVERASSVMSWVPNYATGVVRGSLELRRALTSDQFDAFYSNSSVSLFFSRRMSRTPTMLHLDSTPIQIDQMPTYPGPSDGRPVAALKKVMSRRLYRTVSVIHAWSNWARQSFIDDYDVPEARVKVSPPGIDVEAWRRPLSGEQSHGPVRVLFVGADFERKGGPMLLRWAAARSDGEVELHLVTGSNVASSDGVVVHSGLAANSPQLRHLFHTADVFVLPSLGECFGIATVEAMASRLPVIASDVGGIADIIDDGSNGFIVPVGDERALGCALDRMVHDTALRAVMGTRSERLAHERFDLRDTARRTISELHDLANARRRESSTR